MKWVLDLIIRFILMVLGFIFIFNIASLIGVGRPFLNFHIAPFWAYFKMDLQRLLQISDSSSLDLLRQLKFEESYGYTMTIFGISLSVVIILGMLIVLLVMMTPKKVSNHLKRFINFFEGVPDLLVIFLIQFFVITLYKTTGLKFLQLYGVFGHKPYFVPIVTVSFLPILFLTQFLIKVFEEEASKIYVEYGKAKGLGNFRILVVHMTRNIFPLFIFQLRTIIWIILSNIYLLEYMFNIKGFTAILNLVLLHNDIAALFICLLLFSMPLLVIEAVGFIISKNITGKESVSL